MQNYGDSIAFIINIADNVIPKIIANVQNIIAITLKIFTLFFVILFFSNNINDIIGGIINII